MAERLAFNPLSESYLGDPYPALHGLRERDPIHRWLFGRWNAARHEESSLGTWLATRHRDAEFILRDPRFGMRAPGTGRSAVDTSPTGKCIAAWWMFRNPPQHTAFRRALGNALSIRRARRLRPLIETTAARLIERVRHRGEMDLVADFSTPLARSVLAEMLGLGTEAGVRMLDTAVGPSRLFGGSALTREERENANGSLLILNEQIRDACRWRRSHPGDDLISAVISLFPGRPPAGDDEAVANVVMLIYAGYGTVRDLMSNCVLTLCTHPDALRKLASSPHLVPRAVEEILRFETSVHFAARTALEPVDVGGVQIKQGETVSLELAAANRDPEIFPRPDVFDIDRDGAGHVAFGGGRHYCLGAALARVETEVALTALLERLSELHLPEPSNLTWHASVGHRGPQQLQVCWK